MSVGRLAPVECELIMNHMTAHAA
ncbi:hypothetical protein MICRO80W_830026 [Micrococcus luteus]|nr:hypothetical protein MICRO80W_830026 [Micrococcus luteus]